MCAACQLAATSQHTGAYDFNCLGCCARLVASSRPNRKRQEAMLLVIGKFPGSPVREAILEKLKGEM
jgi:hypothetical protein